MEDYFIDLFRYNQWSNNKVMGVLRVNEVPENSLSFMSHLVVAEIVWLSRTVNEDFGSFGLWKAMDIEKLSLLQSDFDRKWIEMIQMTTDFNKEITYQNTKGDSYSSKLSEIIIHVANHSTYHRGQIAIDLRENGIQAASTDYIFYKRE